MPKCNPVASHNAPTPPSLKPRMDPSTGLKLVLQADWMVKHTFTTAIWSSWYMSSLYCFHAPNVLVGNSSCPFSRNEHYHNFLQSLVTMYHHLRLCRSFVHCTLWSSSCQATKMQLVRVSGQQQQPKLMVLQAHCFCVCGTPAIWCIQTVGSQACVMFGL